MTLIPAEPTTEHDSSSQVMHDARNGTNGCAPAPVPDPEFLRRCAWEIGEQQPGDRHVPARCHVGLAMVAPVQGFTHWRLLPQWIDETARHKGDAWHNCRMIVRLYDVSCIEFNGLNAHHVQDHSIGSLTGQLFFQLPRAGTWQIAEVGFVLRNGEFVAAARSPAVSFPREAVSPRCTPTALYVNPRGRIEEVGNVWEQEKILNERRKPQLKTPLRIATLAFESLPSGHDGLPARFATELAAGQAAEGHEVHVFVPATERLASDCQVGSVTYHPVPVGPEGTPVERALRFARVAGDSLDKLPAFDLVHVCDWMAGLAPWVGSGPTILSLSSIETTRRNGAPPTPLSQEIQRVERELVEAVDCILTPEWLREQAIAEFGLDGARFHAFPMEARLPGEWDCPLDVGQVKKDIGFGPLDRLALFVGPIEHDAGVDLLVEALPTMLRRNGNLRIALVGTGGMHGHLEHRARELNVSFAVRLLGHVDYAFLVRLLRASEALVLPSRRRVHHDDQVVELARRAGRPVVTTHAGPAYLVQHEHNGVVTYDNPGSIVWALDRILGDPAHAEHMGQNGRRGEAAVVRWQDAARLFMQISAASFPELCTREA